MPMPRFCDTSPHRRNIERFLDACASFLGSTEISWEHVVARQSVRAEGVRMRGLGGQLRQILLDGDPAPTGFSLDSIPADLVGRIEIPPTAIAEYSTRSIAETINIVLRKSATRATYGSAIHALCLP